MNNFGTNHLGSFLLTKFLKDLIVRNAARIVVVLSLIHSTAPRYHTNNAYYNDWKLAILFYYTSYVRAYVTLTFSETTAFYGIIKFYSVRMHIIFKRSVYVQTFVKNDLCDQTG